MSATNQHGHVCPSDAARSIVPASQAPTVGDSSLIQDRFIKLKEVLACVAISRTGLYDLIAKGEFPKQIKIGNSSFWSEKAIHDWMEAKKAGGDV